MSDTTDQVPFGATPFGTDDFAENPEPRCPCLLLLDRSYSMQGQPITELNQGLVAFKDELMADPLAAKRVEVATVAFGPVETLHDFHTAPHYFPPSLQAQGDTPMGQAILTGLDLLQTRKGLYRQNGIAFYRPWVFLITDGAPTDAWQHAAIRVQDGEGAKSFAFFAVGVQGANMEILRQITPGREPLALQGLKFRELFQWLSNSMKAVSRSTVGDQVPLESPKGWAAV